MNIGLAIDKKNGVDNRTGNFVKGAGSSNTESLGKFNQKYEEREATNEWQGWGTALKPSYESVIVAQKPYSIENYLLIEILDILNEVIEKCQLKLDVKIVDKFSKLNQAKQCVEENIVLKNAENKTFTKEDLLEVMDMLQSTLMENTNLNIELLCLNFLVEICNQMSKYIIETKINLITELKILKLLVVENILKNTTEENKIKQLGMKQNALTVEKFLKEERLKLNYMSILSAQDNAILKEGKSDLRPDLNQIIVARKPFKGSLVENVIKWGVGGINIDECRVGTEGGTKKDTSTCNNNNLVYGNGLNGGKVEQIDNGRFPANTILTYDQITFDEVCGGFPNTKGNGNIRHNKNNGKGYNCYSNYGDCETKGYEDSGSACRYFYCAKASKRDRDEGLEEFDEKLPACVTDFRPTLATNPENWNNGNPVDNSMMRTALRKNIHPTVKPTELMQYLVRLVSPKGATILDPFMRKWKYRKSSNV